MDEAGNVLDVHVERVMRASAARLGYGWRRTKRREKQLAETLLHLSRELQSCSSHGHTVTLLGLLAGGSRPIPAPSAIAGVVTRVGNLERGVEFHEQAILELEQLASVVDKLETRAEMDQLKVQLEQLCDLAEERQLVVAELGGHFEKLEKRAPDVFGKSERLEREAAPVRNLEQWGDDIAEATNEVKDRVTTLERFCWRRVRRRLGAGYKYPAGLRRTASSHWRTFLLATETGFAVSQTQFIDRVVVLPVAL